MCKLSSRLILTASIALVFLLTAFQAGQPMQQTILYDGNLGGTPDTQGFAYAAFADAATQTFADGVTMLDTITDQSDQAGYFAQDHPPLDSQAGYTVQFTIQIVEENHGSPHRSGFSIIVLSSNLQGIELGFWNDEIWAQEGGQDALFTHAEGVNFDTTSTLTAYNLHISADSYSLEADGTEILSGALRDYTAFTGVLDPYETPNFLFMGDNTTSAGTQANIAYVALQTVAPATSTATSTPSPTATPEPTATPQVTPTLAAKSTPTATAVAPTPKPTKDWNWWFPLTAGYPTP